MLPAAPFAFLILPLLYASMSFLVPEGDDLATVAEALAFIDACEGSEDPSVISNSSDDGSGSSASDVAAVVHSAKTSGSEEHLTKRKRRAKSPAGYSTRLLHRKKEELQQLREQALELETRVEQLQLSRTGGFVVGEQHAMQPKQQGKWMETAMLELHKRQKAEKMNRRLKFILANQAKVDDALRGLVMKRSVLDGMDFVMENQPTARSTLNAVDNSSVIMAELEKRVAQMYLDSDSMFEAKPPSLFSSRMQPKFDEIRGKSIEIVTNAHVSSSLEAASAALWKELTTIRTYPNKLTILYLSVQMQASSPNSMEKNFDQILRSQAGATPVNGLQFMRKYEEKNRMVLARAYVMLLPTDGFHLRAQAWTVITRSETDLLGGCDVRVYIQLSMEGNDGMSATAGDIAYLQDIALNTWSMKMQGHAEYLQDLMIEAADMASLSSVDDDSRDNGLTGVVALVSDGRSPSDDHRPSAGIPQLEHPKTSSMSFLQMDVEDFVTVSEAIAFIDSFEGGEESVGEEAQALNSSNGPSPSPEDESTSSASDGATGSKESGSDEPKPSSRKRKAKNPKGYTTRVLHRKKAELQGLREQVQQLEGRLDRLKSVTPSSRAVLAGERVDETQACKSKWVQLAAAEYTERRRAEETNRKLKAILAHQVQVDKSLRRSLQKRSLLHGMELVFENQPTPSRSFAAFENSKAIMAHLEEKVAKLYLDSGCVFKSGPPPLTSSSMTIKHDKHRGKTAEMISTTPMACPMEMAAALLWKDLNAHRQCPEKWTRYMVGSKPTSLEKHWVLTLQCQSYVKQVNGVQFLRKYEEPNRIVFIKADLMTLTTEGLQFRDQCWAIVTRSETDPLHASVVRVCEQIYMDCQEGFTARPEDLAYAQSVVLRNLSWKLKEHSQQLQDMLVDESERIAIHSALPLPLPTA
ncbi:hypothetical protein BBJ28_00002930 [Nothophytophthora sp. Chile5]|nr:hypothetical protein BBJ28_00002930 [Nothophytophthora sp. Chile5]